MTSPESKTLISGPLAALGAFATLGVGVLIGLGVEMNTATPTPRQSELSTPAVALRSPTRAPHEPAPSGDKSAAPLAVEPPLDASAGAAEADLAYAPGLDPEIERALQRVTPPETNEPVVLPSAVRQPAQAPQEVAPIQVEQGPQGVTIQTKQVVRTLHTLTADGLPTTKELKLEGFDVTIAGPGNFRQTRNYGTSDRAVLGTDPGLADGLYKYSVSPRMQRISSLSGKSPLAQAEGAPVVLTPNGRNALDPDIQAAAALPRLEGSSGTFRIANGQLVSASSNEELDPLYGASDQDEEQ